MPYTIRAKAAVGLGWLLLAGCLGCAQSSLTTAPFAGLTKSSAETPETPKAASSGLPPKQAAQACMVAAEELQKNGHLKQATLLYEKARANDPTLKTVSHRLAVLYDAQGDSTRALIEYNRALEDDPKNPNVLSDLGFFHYHRGNLSEAEQNLRGALAIDPKHQKATSNLALVLAQQGRIDESFEAFSKVVGPAAAHSNVGVLLAKQGRHEEAAKSFQQALAIDPTLQQPRAFLSYLENRPRDGSPQQVAAQASPSARRETY